MILAIECVVACVVFTAIFVGGVLWNKEAFLHEYAPEVQKRFLESNPDYVLKEKGERTKGLMLAKTMMCIFFIAVLTGLIYLAGARSFWIGVIDTYIIWSVVNWYDVVVLDMGIFAHWKKVRLRGTEDMDAEYNSNTWHHVKGGLFGTVLGIPISLICGGIIYII